jgi:hypothetical protein
VSRSASVQIQAPTHPERPPRHPEQDPVRRSGQHSVIPDTPDPRLPLSFLMHPPLKQRSTAQAGIRTQAVPSFLFALAFDGVLCILKRLRSFTRTGLDLTPRYRRRSLVCTRQASRDGGTERIDSPWHGLRWFAETRLPDALSESESGRLPTPANIELDRRKSNLDNSRKPVPHYPNQDLDSTVPSSP